MNQVRLRQYALRIGPGRALSTLLVAGVGLVLLMTANPVRAQWFHSYNRVATAAPVYGNSSHQQPNGGSRWFSSAATARPSSTGNAAAPLPSPYVAYGGYGPPARLMGRPGEPRTPPPQNPPVGHQAILYNAGGTPTAYRQLSTNWSDPAGGVAHTPPHYAQPVSPCGPSGGNESCGCSNSWGWQIVPEGLLYPNYLAGVKEPRMGAVFNNEANDGWKWDLSIGGRFGVVRYGTPDAYGGQGWQLDVEACANPRLDPESNMDLEATDYRFGIPLTYARGRYRMKIAYFHLSSHLGDEFAIRNGLGGRINYSRDAILWGHSYLITDNLTAYGEVGFGFKTDVNEPWDFQFGLDYSSPCANGFRGSPFFALNAHLREEVDFGGNAVAQVGWQWRSRTEGHLLRVGLQYYNGKHERYEFFDTSEQKFGFGIWYDF